MITRIKKILDNIKRKIKGVFIPEPKLSIVSIGPCTVVKSRPVHLSLQIGRRRINGACRVVLTMSPDIDVAPSIVVEDLLWGGVVEEEVLSKLKTIKKDIIELFLQKLGEKDIENEGKVN